MKKASIYRKPMQEGIFEEEFTLEALSAMGNPLEQVSSLVDFELFRPALESVLVKDDCKTAAGRSSTDVVLMFKVIFLQRYFGLGDHQIQYQITDRASVHDSNVIGPLITEEDKGQRLYLDAGYTCLVYNIFRYCQINKYQPQLLSPQGIIVS